MGKRDDLVPEDFLEHLRLSVSGFRGEDERHQMAVASMLWTGTTKRRAHSHFENHFWFTYKEIGSEFGRGRFKVVNGRLDMFSVTNWSKEAAFTKGYALTEKARRVMATYLSKAHLKPTRLLFDDLSGVKSLKTIPRAVASRDTTGVTATAWRRARVVGKTPLSLEALRRLKRWLTKVENKWRAGDPPKPYEFTKLPTLDQIERLNSATSRIIRMSNIDVLGPGHLLHRYVQSGSGRLYAKGISLQNAPTLIKWAALVGQWEYDIANCHFTIVDQMAGRHGYDCVAIRHYLANKHDVRQAIANRVSITAEQAKVCLLATLYGARASVYYKAAIPGEIGFDAAAMLYEEPVFKAIKDDIQGARRAILAGWPVTKNGRLVNAFKKSIVRTAKAEVRLAHLVQGVEALALKTVIDMYPDQISLVQHDGWVAPNQLDAAEIEMAILDRTGYRLELEEAPIKIDLDAYFKRA